MLTPRRPTAATIAAFIRVQRDTPFSYTSVGATRGQPPRGYAVDYNRVKLGHGEHTFLRAVDALRRWEMFNIGWVELCWPSATIEEGATVAVLIRLFAFWSLNAARVVYIVDERHGPVRRFGFAYGTLADHMESGEERFSVEWHESDDSVWYDLFAFSRPRHVLARIGRPLSRHLQRRFARDSLRAMARAAAP